MQAIKQGCKRVLALVIHTLASSLTAIYLTRSIAGLPHLLARLRRYNETYRTPTFEIQVSSDFGSYSKFTITKSATLRGQSRD